LRSIRVINLHLHTVRCNHASGTVAEMAAAAHAAGLREIGFAEHGPLPQPIDDWRLDLLDLPLYQAEIEAARSEFPDMPIRFGLELDYLPQFKDFYADLHDVAPFDFLIISVHYIGDWNFDWDRYIDGYNHRDIDDIYRSYYALVREAVAHGVGDIVGHLDLPKRFGHRPSDAIREEAEKTLEVIAGAGLVLELNTAGLLEKVQEVYPEDWIVRRAVELGIPFTLGTDAHDPANVDTGLEWAVRYLHKLGVREVATFERRRMKRVALEPEWKAAKQAT